MEGLEQPNFQDVLLDSTLIIDYVRKRDRGGFALLEEVLEAFHYTFISTISIYEVETGAVIAGRQSDIQKLLPFLKILDVTEAVALEAANIYAELRRKNRLVQANDIFIAATARLYRLPLLTYNVAHFKRIQGLPVGDTIEALRPR